MTIYDGFHDVRLPGPVCYKLIGSDTFLTEITENDNYEVRNIRRQSTRGRWVIPAHGMDDDTFAEFQAFWLMMRGSGYGFLIIDRADYQATDSFIGIGDAAETDFQLYKNYTDSVIEHAITAASTGDDTFTVAGDLTWWFSAGDFINVDDSTGNDGYWVIDTVTLVGTDTVIAVTGDITDGTADGNVQSFYRRTINKPASTDTDGTASTVDLTVNGVSKTEDTHYTVDYTTGIVDFSAGSSPLGAPPTGHRITATFKFNKAVRFNTDDPNYTHITVSLRDIDIPIIELLNLS